MSEDKKEVVVPQQVARANAELIPGKGIVPRNLEELYRVATAFCASGLMPKGMNRAEQVMVAAQMGSELGLSLMQSVQNIAVINGRPSFWGDMPLALVKQSGLLEYISEFYDGEGENLTAYCEVKRKGEQEVIREWSWRDAVKAGLSGKDVWKNYPKRMCQMRARSWALKDVFPDVIRGVAIAEYDDHSQAYSPDAVGPANGEVIAVPTITDLMGDEPQAASKLVGDEPQAASKSASKKKAPANATMDEAAAAESENEFRAEWAKLRGGYREYVLENIDRFRAASRELQKEARAKWFRMSNITDGWPLDRDDEQPQAENPTQQPDAGVVTPEPEATDAGTRDAVDDDIFATAEWEELTGLYAQYPDAYNDIRADFDVSNNQLTVELMRQMIDAIKRKAGVTF